jgi:hypothetical protein
MKLVKTAFIFCSALALISACSNSNQKTISEVEQEQDEAAMPDEGNPPQDQSDEAMKPTEFDGTIAKTKSGLSLKTGAGEFMIEGQDLSDMVGKKVKVVGALEESESGQKIHITAVTPLE